MTRYEKLDGDVCLCVCGRFDMNEVGRELYDGLRCMIISVALLMMS